MKLSSIAVPVRWLLSILPGLFLPSTLLTAAPLPNIVIVMPDDMGYGDLSCLGNPVIKTPALDGFWKQSLRFTNFHVSPTCSPTRSALLTGRHEFKNGVTHTIHERERLTLKARTLPELLKASGYTTGIFGKWHLGDEVDRWPDKRGFDEMFIHGAGGIGQSYPGSCGDVPGNRYFDPTVLHNGRFEKTTGYCTDVFFAQAEKWIDTVKGRQPFLAYITPNAPHGPLVVADSYASKYRGRVPDNVAKFYGMIENVDENFGRLLARLDQWGIADNTLVIFLTDNGSATGTGIFNAGMRGAKVSPYEGGTRVPSFWRWPAGIQAKGVDCSVLTAHIDVLPTLLQIIGAQPDEKARQQIEGRSLLPLLKNPQAEWPDRFLVTHVGRWPAGKATEWKFKGCSIRNTRYSLVNNEELYDLDEDPGQRHNILAQQPEVAETLRKEYERWWESVLPCLENETAVGPKINPFKQLYEQQLAESTTAKPPARKNVLILFSDDQRADTIAALGNRQLRTPNLDRLVKRGTAIRGAYCMGSDQGAVCVPSRAMLLSGRTLFRLGNWEAEPTWPSQFASAGYRTFITGKWHNGRDALGRAFQQGRAVFLGGMVNPLKCPVIDFPPMPTGKPKVTPKHCVELFADEAIEFIKTQKDSQESPWLCYVPFNAPHDPCIVPDDFPVQYDPATLDLPRNHLLRHPFDNGELSIRDEKLIDGERTPAAVRKELADYYRAVSFLDAQVGRVLETLEASGQADRTIVVFTSDHGLAKGSHGLLGKQNLYDHSMHSPLIVAGPGIPAGEQSQALCYLLDIFPTLGELVGVPAPPKSEGQSFADVLLQKRSTHRQQIFTAYRNLQRAVRDDRWKLIRYTVGPQITTQLFDLQNDPDELHNLAESPDHAADRNRLEGNLKSLQFEFSDPMAKSD